MTNEEIISAVKEMTVLELNDLVKAIEEEFGVTAAAPVAVGGGAAEGAAAEEEKSEFDVVLESAGDSKIKVVKAVRELTGLGLKDAKEIADSAPKAIKEGVAKGEDEEMTAKLQAVGATVEVKEVACRENWTPRHVIDQVFFG